MSLRRNIGELRTWRRLRRTSRLEPGSLTRMESLTKTQLEIPGTGGELDRQAADDATDKTLDSLLAHGLVEDMEREDAKGFKTLTTRWGKRWRMKDGEWKMKVRFVGREYKWAEHGEDFIFSWRDAFCESCDRLLGIEHGLGDVRGRRSGCLPPGS